MFGHFPFTHYLSNIRDWTAHNPCTTVISSEAATMRTRTAPGIGRYLYALTNNRRDEPCGFPGINGRPAYVIAGDQVAAVVSDLPRRRIPCARHCRGVHEQVLKRLLVRGAVLPVVRQAARRLHPGFVLEYTGPWSPQHFATMKFDFLQEPARIVRPEPRPASFELALA